MEMAALGMTPGHHHSPQKVKKTAASVKNSFVGGSFIGGDIGLQSETES